MSIFFKNNRNSSSEIYGICDRYGLTTVDCLKDENMISIEEYDNGELGGDCLFEFQKIGDDLFMLTWQEQKLNLTINNINEACLS